MSKWIKGALLLIGLMAIAVLIAYAIFTRNQATEFLTNTHADIQARVDEETAEGRLFMNPAELDLPYEEVTVTNDAGLRLHGWYIPSQNGAAVMLQHGFLELPYHMLEEAEMLYNHGYGTLLTSVRAHNFSDGYVVGFGCQEMADMEAWYRYLLTREDVDPEMIAVLGQSMGGSLVIQYAYENQNIKAIISHSAFSSLPDVLVVGAKAYFPDIPDWFASIFANTLVFWMERDLDCDIESLDAKEWAASIGPRPMLVIDAELDSTVNRDAGELIFEAAGAPKEFWQCPGSDHHECDTDYPQEFEDIVVSFLDQHLLGNE